MSSLYFLDKYIDGMNMDYFKSIPEVSYYNSNYHIGLDGDLLYADSDDDNTTEWFVVKYNNFNLLGYSYSSNNEKLEKTSEKGT